MILRRVAGSGLFRRATWNFMVGFGMLAMPLSTYAANLGNASDASTAHATSIIASTSARPTAEPGRPLPVKIEPRTPTTAEMARAMEMMEERVRQLESQLMRLSEDVANHATKAAKAECANALSGVAVTKTELRQAAPVVLPEMPNARVKLSFKSMVKSAKAMFAVAPTAPAITNALPVPAKPANTQLMPVPQQAPAPATAPAPKKDDNAGALNFFKDVEVSGIVDGYYGYNSKHYKYCLFQS